ncbi:acyltransferase family protein [Poseidonocella sedimentorum]|uniref:Peptidoglycan/LPS O-acetylase OafA/YrhL, contains acyltransferase and SGNH-hydrolase domains n=1 Tax=Poseidonocella sedimentorum TaxID=871652 RepID=A0A1I6EJF0_9RHOB|nr:acyltransferase [Poseidonocella sedimentorum]SFR17815.1 Peptidoglycan/LPS O-acetylase OafA/YrhL, contains acyltransferase and SGNH-hydrolase domains [Poseidonocella sedimentorum]
MERALPADLRTLTSFRFFAAFWVFLFHLRSRIEYDQNWFWSVIENGARGVDFFFVLSGFVIFHVYEPKISDGTFSFRRYVVKRFARIYPLHAVMLLVFVALSILRGSGADGIFASVLLFHAWGVTDGLVLNGPSWTLSAEMFAYLLFGVLVNRSPGTSAIVAALCVSAIAAHFIALGVGKSAFIHLTWDYGIVRIVPSFILGMLLRRLTPIVPAAFAAIMGFAGIVALLILASAPAGYEVFLPFSLLIISGAKLSDRRNLPTNSKLFVYLGEISYSTYMIHIFVIAVWFDYLPKLGIAPLPWPAICVMVLACSVASYHVIELPARRWINGLGRNRSVNLGLTQ